jgi:hypothetical protein
MGRSTVVFAGLLVLSISLAAFAAPPSWWSARGVIATNGSGQPLTADDWSLINQGQVKKLATAAYDEMEVRLSGGAGTAVTTLIKSWYQIDPNTGAFVLDGNGKRIPRVTGQTDDYATVNLGQLKKVAKPFYDRLGVFGYTELFPWPVVGISDDWAVANIGQAKNLFRFELSSLPPDTDGDGLPDSFDFDRDGLTNAYETAHGTDPRVAGAPGDFDGDGIPNDHDARPTSAAVGQLSVTITSPANGATIP